MKAAAALLAVMVSVSTAFVQAYTVEPVQQSWSGWTPGDPQYNHVSQTVTCCWDSLEYCELFVGQADTSLFSVHVYESPGGIDWVARKLDVAPQGPYRWLPFDLEHRSGYEFTKGKQYEFRFTRSGTDSINFYYDFDDPYDYGNMIVGGDGTGSDLCLRVYGRMDTVGSGLGSFCAAV